MAKKYTLMISALAAGILGCTESGEHQAKDWRSHPALAEPDGHRHRGDKMVGHTVDDPRVLGELSRRFKMTRNYEYFLRLLDYYYFNENRLVGMTQSQVEEIFGPGDPDRDFPGVQRLRWAVLPDFLFVTLEDDRVVSASYIMGY